MIKLFYKVSYIMYELNGIYESETFFLEIENEKFSISDKKKQEVCSGFIVYISSFVLNDKKTKLAVTNRNLVYPETDFQFGTIESLFYQRKNITIDYLNAEDKLITIIFKKIE
ncbi:MAG: hypothetical protein ACOX1F_04770 [Erysipelotrichaceae bacterium]